MTETTRWPDFFLVGAPKCGTTAMNDYLAQHPGIFIPFRKELHYFGSDLQGTHFVRDRQAYLALFAGARADQVAGEASVWYLTSERAAGEIRQANPHARILIMLREPVSMLHSLHSQMLYNGNEDIADFAEALAAEDDRRAGRRLPPDVMNPTALHYRRHIRYAEQVGRYFTAFGRERTKVILFDDFRRDTAGACREVFAFLGVDAAFEPSIRVVNANKRVRFETMKLFFRKPPALLKRAGRLLVPSAKARQALWARLQRLNTRYEPRSPMDPALRAELTREFAPQVEALAELLGRDLSRWSRPPAAGG
ncbi:MAG: sulfotransferase domain-containing protein [Planctomycetes bacterium]|nr:sulfotransferase domain-containing protein [Planctomycetota bacterium]